MTEPTTPTPPTWLTLTDVATYLGVSPPTVRRMIDRGEFPPGAYIGEFPRWTLEEVERWIATRRGSSPRTERGAPYRPEATS